MIKPFLLLLFLAANNILFAQTQNRIYLANDDHTDYMWTANESRYDSSFIKMLDYYLDQIDSTRNLPSDFQTRFNCDGSFWLKAYQKHRTPAQFQRLVKAIQSQHISIPLNLLVSCYGAQPTEAVIRGMYYSGQQERKLGLRFTLALCMENQTMPLGLSGLWAGSGAKYSWRGVCGCATKLPKSSFANRRNQLYRYTGLDGSSVLMKWYSKKSYGGRVWGGYSEARWPWFPQAPDSMADKFITAMDSVCSHPKTSYPFRAVGVFGFGNDDLETFSAPAFTDLAKQYSTSGRKVRVSNETDFFEDIEKNYLQLPSESVSYGNEWDTYCATMNETTAKVRRATEKLRTTEALATIVSLTNADFAKGLDSLKNDAWEAFGLYWEHDWTADGPVSQKARAEWQIKIQKRISMYVDSLYTLSINALGRQISVGNQPRFFVFNPLSWERTDVVDLPFSGKEPITIFDLSTGKEVNSQEIEIGGKKFQRILAEKVPSVGNKIFEIRKGKPRKEKPAGVLTDGYFSNQFHKIRVLKSGVISEWVDLKTGRQLVKNTEGKLVNDLGSINKDAGNNLIVENEGPVSTTIKAISTDPVLHASRITLFKNSSRIDIEDSIMANFKDLKTWSFAFNLQDQTTRHEELGAIITAKKETRGGHYASQNARYDWLTFNHFADMSADNYGITISNLDCSFFKLGNSTPDSLWENSTLIQALAGGQTDSLENKKTLGINGQFGQSQFQYNFSLQTHNGPFNQTESMKFGLEHQNPLVAGMVAGINVLNTKVSYSLLQVSDPNVILWSLKPADEGIQKGIITRFWNLRNKPVAFSPILGFKPKSFWQCTHLETNEKQLGMTKESPVIQLKSNQLQTFRWVLK